MKTKPLIETNPYLANAKMRKKSIALSARTSCGVEGIKAKTGKKKKFNIIRRDKKIYHKSK